MTGISPEDYECVLRAAGVVTASLESTEAARAEAQRIVDEDGGDPSSLVDGLRALCVTLLAAYAADHDQSWEDAWQIVMRGIHRSREEGR